MKVLAGSVFCSLSYISSFYLISVLLRVDFLEAKWSKDCDKETVFKNCSQARRPASQLSYADKCREEKSCLEGSINNCEGTQHIYSLTEYRKILELRCIPPEDRKERVRLGFCTQENMLSTCNMSEIRESVMRSNMEFVLDRKTLAENCKKIQKLLDCVDDAIHNCLGNEGMVVFRRLVASPMKFVEELCAPSSELMQGYLKHSKCWDAISSDLKECAEGIDQLVHTIIVDYDSTGLNKTDELQKPCCDLDEKMHCQHALVLQTCGEDAVMVIDKIQKYALGHWLPQKCEEHWKNCFTVDLNHQHSTKANLYSIPVSFALYFVYIS